MPIRRIGDRWAIGRGKPIYDTKDEAEKAYRAYLWSKYGKRKGKRGGHR